MWRGRGVCGGGGACMEGEGCVWRGRGVCGGGGVCVEGEGCVWRGRGVCGGGGGSGGHTCTSDTDLVIATLASQFSYSSYQWHWQVMANINTQMAHVMWTTCARAPVCSMLDCALHGSKTIVTFSLTLHTTIHSIRLYTLYHH